MDKSANKYRHSFTVINIVNYVCILNSILLHSTPSSPNSSSWPSSSHLIQPYQLLEYQTDMRRCRFDTLGKQTSAHRAGGPTPYKGWVPPARWVSADAASAGGIAAHPRGGWTWRCCARTHPPCGRDPPLVRGGPTCKVGRGLFP